MTGTWPLRPHSAGWGIVFFARDQHGRPWFLGALGGPVATSAKSHFFLGAKRATSPVAELTAPLVLLILLRASHISLPLCC